MTTSMSRGTHFLIYRSDANRYETPEEIARDCARRKARGEPPRNLIQEPSCLWAGPRFSFYPFPWESDSKPYAVVWSPHSSSPTFGAHEEPLTSIATNDGEPLVLNAQGVVEAAREGLHGFEVRGGAVVDDGSCSGAVQSYALALRADEEKRRAEANAQWQAKIESDKALAKAAPLMVGSSVWYWERRTRNEGFAIAASSLLPYPAIVVSVSPRGTHAMPSVDLVSFGAAQWTPRGGISYSAVPRNGFWSWPDADMLKRTDES